MDYKIENKKQFTVAGIKRVFHSETSYAKIPEFWNEHLSGEYGKVIFGTYGICFDCLPNGEFYYMIADDCLPQTNHPDMVEVKVIPEGTWAVFPCVGQLPQALQIVNTKIWQEWLPNSTEYRLAGNYNIEFYTQDENYSEIWIPVEKIR